MENIIEFSHPEDPLPFADSFWDDLDAEVFEMYFPHCLGKEVNGLLICTSRAVEALLLARSLYYIIDVSLYWSKTM